MSTIAAAVYDAVAALPGRSCSMQEVRALPGVDRDQVKKRCPMRGPQFQNALRPRTEFWQAPTTFPGAQE
jgi:hypothetical protein